jgi:hypothetical protein
MLIFALRVLWHCNPCRSDVEYKYVVINQQGGVVRWQEGANNTLCLRGSGFLMHITDSWAHESRQVHEIGVPVPSQQQQRRRAAGGSSSGSKTPAAASPVLLQNIACFTSSSSSGPAAAEGSEVADSSASSMLQQQQQQQVLPPSIHRSSSFNPQPELDPLSQDVARLLPQLQTELASALAALANNSSSSTQQDSAAILEGLQQQQQTSAGVTPLPAELLVTSFDQEFADEADVTAALQEQEQLTAAAAAMAAEAEAAVARLQQQQQQRLAPVDVFAIAKQALITPPSAAVPGSLAAAAAAAAAASATPSSSSSSGRRSPSGSPGSSLASASEDEIAAALLSDDCEEACLCLVDAICSCMNCGDSNSAEPCELDHLYDEFAEQPQQQQQQQGLPAAAAAAAAAAPEAAESAAFTAAAAGFSDASAAAVVDDEPTPVEQLAAMQGFVPEPAAASASATDNDGLGNGCFTGVKGTADARAEAFGGVNRALQQSADLLDNLSDPTHPLMLKADRELADAKRHMGHLLAA